MRRWGRAVSVVVLIFISPLTAPAEGGRNKPHLVVRRKFLKVHKRSPAKPVLRVEPISHAPALQVEPRRRRLQVEPIRKRIRHMPALRVEPVIRRLLRVGPSRRALRVEPVRKLQVEPVQPAPALQVERVQPGRAKPALVVETAKTRRNPGPDVVRDPIKHPGTGPATTPLVELAKVPRIHGTKELGLTLGASVAALVAYDHALKVEEAGTPKEKATAWRALASAAGKNPYRKTATQRADAWDAYSRNRSELRKAVVVAWTKLTKLLPLSVLDIAQKKALVQQFRERFGSLPKWIRKLKMLVSLWLVGPPREAPAATVAGLRCLGTRDGLYLQARGNGKLSGGASRCGIEQAFALIDADGGDLQTGDRVFVRSPQGRYWTALRTGHLVALRTSVGLPESFTIIKVGGSGPIVAGDRIALRSLAFKRFVIAPLAGSAHATSKSPGARGTFSLQGYER